MSHRVELWVFGVDLHPACMASTGHLVRVEWVLYKAITTNGFLLTPRTHRDAKAFHIYHGAIVR